MSETEFRKRVAELQTYEHREDFERSMVELFWSASSEQCGELRAMRANGKLNSPKVWRNPSDYERSDLTHEERVRERLAAISLCWGSDDSRDDLMTIAFCYHNLLMLGNNADETLHDAARRADPRVAHLLLGFLNRLPEDKSMKAFALHMVQTPAGPQAQF